MDGDAVFEEAELFEALGVFKRAVGEGGELREGGGGVGVEADVFPVLNFLGGVAVERDGGAGEVEGTAGCVRNYFYGVGVVDVGRSAERFNSGDLHASGGEGFQECGDVFWAEEGLVALDVDVDICGNFLGDCVEAVGAGGKLGAGEFAGPIILMA